MHVRLEHCHLYYLNILPRGGLLEEFLEERSGCRIDHGLPIERRPSKMNEQLMG